MYSVRGGLSLWYADGRIINSDEPRAAQSFGKTAPFDPRIRIPCQKLIAGFYFFFYSKGLVDYETCKIFICRPSERVNSINTGKTKSTFDVLNAIDFLNKWQLF